MNFTSNSIAGLPDFFLNQKYQNGKNLPNDHKLYPTAINYTKWPLISHPNGHKKYQHFHYQGPPKFTQIRIFGLKINHLANPAASYDTMRAKVRIIPNFVSWCRMM
jgi:hypothetical protein